MTPNRSDDLPSLPFVHNDHEFIITAVPDGADVLLHIADRYGRMLLPASTRVVGANGWPGGRPNHRLIGAAMAKLRRSVERLVGEKFLNFLETPRAASEFRWTPPELEAARKIDWSKPAATLVHQGYYFLIGAFVTPERMVILLRDPDGPFDAPMSIPKESMMRSEAKGVDPLDFGVNIMVDRIRGWDASRTEAFVRDTPRLVVDQRQNWSCGKRLLRSPIRRSMPPGMLTEARQVRLTEFVGQFLGEGERPAVPSAAVSKLINLSIWMSVIMTSSI